jgi:hypothetical protein
MGYVIAALSKEIPKKLSEIEYMIAEYSDEITMLVVFVAIVIIAWVTKR